MVYCEPLTVEYILELDVYSEQRILSLTLSCAAARVDGSVPDPRHTHIPNHQEGQRPPVPPGAVHRLQSDCKYGSRPACRHATGPDFDLYASDQINDGVKRNVVGFFRLLKLLREENQIYMFRRLRSVILPHSAVCDGKSKSCDVCAVQGEAVSEFSKDPADNSTNYCSLQNLIDGKYLATMLCLES